MSYVTLAQLTERFGEAMLVQLTDRAMPATNEVDAEVVDRALADTDAQIDGYLVGRYRLPLAETPAMITDIAASIAVYKLHRNTVSEKVKDDYNQALKALRDIASGVIRLSVEGVEPQASGSSGVRTADRDRDMTPDNLRGFI
jgi:phage gp36-like protein